ncbi:MAG: acyl-CoA desaturase [Candidatus Xenobia bacterium]
MLHILWWLIGWHVVSALGITVGYHRLATHRSFQCPKWLEYFWVTLGFTGTMGPPISWVAMHRLHHAQSDQPGDPHSPVQKGWRYAQFGWIIDRIRQKRLYDRGVVVPGYQDSINFDSAFIKRWAKDICDDKFYRGLNFWVYMGIVVSTSALCYLLGGWPAVLGRLLSILTVPWCTWYVNSYAHSDGYGYRTWQTRDNSRNVWWVALLTNGEGWHNNHHYAPASARHGLAWWEFDLSWITIRSMQLVGLAWKVHGIRDVDRDVDKAA